MRVLFSTTAGAGHFGPMVPIAKACAAAGHEVRVAAPESFAPAVVASGLVHEPFPDVPADVKGPFLAGLVRLPPAESNVEVLREVFCRLDAQAALPTLTALLDRWQPDIVLREPCEFGSLAAAEAAHVPHAQVAIGMGSLELWAREHLAEPLAELGSKAGLPSGRLADAAALEVVFTSVPERLDEAGTRNDQGRARTYRYRYATSVPQKATVPPAWGDPRRPLVYVSYGSVAGGFTKFVEMFRLTLEALADSPVRVLLTVGNECDPASLEPLPANAHVERWWPQEQVMPDTAVVVSHGGFGTTMIAIAAGVPQLAIPLFAIDQRINAKRVAATAVGMRLDGGSVAAGQVAAHVRHLINDPTHKREARRMAKEMAGMPSASDVVSVIEMLARGATEWAHPRAS